MVFARNDLFAKFDFLLAHPESNDRHRYVFDGTVFTIDGVTWDPDDEPELVALLAAYLTAREQGQQDVLDFVAKGHFLHDQAPTAQFAREVVSGWQSWGKAKAEKNDE